LDCSTNNFEQNKNQISVSFAGKMVSRRGLLLLADAVTTGKNIPHVKAVLWSEQFPFGQILRSEMSEGITIKQIFKSTEFDRTFRICSSNLGCSFIFFSMLDRLVRETNQRKIQKHIIQRRTVPT
jgi:hypothetical protein